MPGSVFEYARSPSPVRRAKTPRAYTSMACMDQRNVWSPDLVADVNIAGMYTDHYTGDKWRNVDDNRMEDYGMGGYLPAVSPAPSPRPYAPSPHRGKTPRNPSPTYEAELDDYNHLNMMMPFQDPRARLHSSYTRRIRNHRRDDGSPPRVKSGRAGGSWRHISQTNGHQGNNILFIEGTVKQADASNYPPYGWAAEEQGAFMHYVSPRMIPRQRPVEQNTRVPKATNYTSYYNNHARKGFKYWYQEKKPKGNSAPLNSIQSRLMSLRT